jgi:16S rRNA (guanine1516-N2)-methyltransferase
VRPIATPTTSDGPAPAPGAATAVVAATPADEARADRVAAALNAPRLTVAAWRAGAGGAVVVWVDGEGVALRGPAASGADPVRPTPPPRSGRGGRDPLLRAIGAAADVIDATAGWGADAGVLAAAGRRVRMLERHPVLALVLADALERWRAAEHPAAARLELLAVDARHALASLRADAVLLDPMYPERGKRGRKGEDLALARRLVGDDGDQDELLAAARAAARRRVVVKRPRTAPYLAGRVPTGSIVGRTTRYDLYPPSAEEPT